jgi:hypothetical protein
VQDQCAGAMLGGVGVARRLVTNKCPVAHENVAGDLLAAAAEGRTGDRCGTGNVAALPDHSPVLI